MNSKALRPQILLALASLVSGAALVISIFTKASLALMLVLLGIFASLLVITRWRKASLQERVVIRKKLLTGLLAGVVATVAYDLSRWLLVIIADWKFWPFESFAIFGHLIAGQEISRSTAFVVGTAYHALNGVLFAVAYCFLLGGRAWFYGVLWALVLELAMFTIYPGWLDLEAVMKEFTVVSLSGHVAYGSVLGLISQYRISFPPSASQPWKN